MKKVLSVILVLLMVFLVGYYIFDVVYNQTPVTENLVKTLGTLCVLIGSMIRLHYGKGRRADLDFYEKSYGQELGSAFRDNSSLRKKLVSATRLYNEEQYTKALKCLDKLMEACKNKYDARAVLLFTALCYSDMGLCDLAIQTYHQLLEQDPDSARTYSNIGVEYIHKGEYAEAIDYFEQAITLDPTYAEAYNNIASCLFRLHELEEAIPYAEKALELKKNLYQASGLLATIYALLGEEEKKEKYFHMAVANGKNAQDLQAGIQRFMTEKEEFFNPDEEEDEVV